MAPIMLNVIIIVAAASPIRTIFEVIVLWVLSDDVGLSTIEDAIYVVYKSLVRGILPKFGKKIILINASD
jgi:hypothetical protein